MRIIYAAAAGLVVAVILSVLAAANGDTPGGVESGGLFTWGVATAVAWIGLRVAGRPRRATPAGPQQAEAEAEAEQAGP